MFEIFRSKGFSNYKVKGIINIMNLSIGKKITGGFLFITLLVVCMSAFTLYEFNQLDIVSNKITKENMEKIQLSLGIANDLANEAVVMRRFNFTGDEADILIYNQYKQDINEKLIKSEQLFVTEGGKKLIQKIKAEKNNYEDIAEKSIQAKHANNPELVALYMKQAGQPFKAANVATDELVKDIQEFVKSEERRLDEEKNQTQLIIIGVNILIAIAGVVIGLWISRKIAKPLTLVTDAAAKIADGDLTQPPIVVASGDEVGQLAQSFNQMSVQLRQLISKLSISAENMAASSEEMTASADQSAQAANQVAISITDIAQGSQQQLNAVTKTSAVVQNMSASVQQIAATANEVATSSSRAAATAQVGTDSIEKAVNQMQQIQETVASSVQLVTVLGGRSQEIGQIVDTISGIAGQTNLLALNAAIEAARAGEQGRGFAVVAEEVRKLAEQSQEAAKQISVLISQIQGETNNAVTAMDAGSREVELGAKIVTSAGKAFSDIVSAVSDVSTQIVEISTAIQHLADGSQQIVHSVNEIDQISKSTASETETVSAATEEQSASMEEIASSSQALAHLAEELNTAVRTFRI